MTTEPKPFDVERVNLLNRLALTKKVMEDIQTNPEVRVLNLDEVTLDRIKEYLRSKHAQLWANFSILSTDSLEKAAIFFQSELNKLYAHLAKNTPSKEHKLMG